MNSVLITPNIRVAFYEYSYLQVCEPHLDNFDKN
jgi:hypothetical protein